MARKKVIVIGCGNRGEAYTDIMADKFGEDFEIIGVAEPIAARRNYMKEKHNIPDEMCFESWEPLLDLPKTADVALIATMDRDHYAPAMAAIEKGYNLLLEKPIAPTPEQCREIQRAAEKKGIFVLVCHVLRFTNFFIALKNIIDSGEIGRVMNIQHIECVGNVHQTHSFVRGNWGNSDRSSPMILQKTCHDMDILQWLIGKPCTAVQSFGCLSYFKKENAPEGAPERCIEGCPHADTCPYDAMKLYVESDSTWFRTTATKEITPTDEDVKKAMWNTQYGKCVYKCDNNVVDHQTVNMRFGDDVFVDFAMSAFCRSGRVIHIMGTEGEIRAKMDSNEVEVHSFITGNTRMHDCNSTVAGDTITSGHGGGDDGIVYALRELLDGKASKSICSVGESCDNHMISFAAEESRIHGGKLVEMDEYLTMYNLK